MKITKLIFWITVSSTVVSCKAQHRTSDDVNVDSVDSSVFYKLKSMEFEKYIDKTSVGQFLIDVGFKYRDSTLGFAPTSYLRYITYSYSDKLWVEIQVNEFKYMSSWSPEHKWEIEKFKKEKIGAIRFKYLGKCVKCSP